jgi:hypothetical protein
MVAQIPLGPDGTTRRHRACGSFPRLGRRPLDHWRRQLRFRRTPLNAGIQFGSEVSYLAIGER